MDENYGCLFTCTQETRQGGVLRHGIAARQNDSASSNLLWHTCASHHHWSYTIHKGLFSCDVVYD